jgi:hypothetical protein
MSFFFQKQNKKANQILSGQVGTGGKGEDIRKGVGR